MRFTIVTVFISLLLCFSVTHPALADINTALLQGEKSIVTITGNIDSINEQGSFILKDQSGSIQIVAPKTELAALNKGDRIRVTGTIQKEDKLVKVIATKIRHKQLIPNASPSDEDTSKVLAPYNINSEIMAIGKLPGAGIVKLSGEILGLDEDGFILKDDTGEIQVESAHTSTLASGKHITVLGKIDDGFFSKKIQASQIIIHYDIAPIAMK